MDISIVIVSYNTCKLTEQCIRSVYEQTRDIDFEIIVVDNASKDGSPDHIEQIFPDVTLIRSKENLGFARANNLGSQYAKGKYLLLLNSDTVILESAIQQQFAFAQKQSDNIGIFGGSTYFENGTRNPTSCWSKPTLWSTFCIAIGLTYIFRNIRFFNRESFSWWNWLGTLEVDIISGCFLMIKKNLWDKLDGFSPDFFMYGEDADLCMRAAKEENKCLVNPAVKIVHYGGRSDTVLAQKIIKLFKGKNQFIAKHRLAHPYIKYVFDLWAFNRKIAYSIARLANKSKINQYNSWNEVLNNRKEWHIR